MWTDPTSNSEAARRAGGRRRYNAMRQTRALARLEQVLNLKRAGWSQRQIARALGVHPSTICRDLRHFLAAYNIQLDRLVYRYNFHIHFKDGRWTVTRPYWRPPDDA